MDELRAELAARIKIDTDYERLNVQSLFIGVQLNRTLKDISKSAPNTHWAYVVAHFFHREGVIAVRTVFFCVPFFLRLAFSLSG